MTEYVAYLRVSTQRQGVSGLGLEAQRAAVEQFVRSASGKLLAEFVEVESGARRSRPILERSIAHCRKEGATLLIAKLDRLARNVAFVSSLMEGRVDFVAADAPYANKLMIHILAAFAEHEREQISERTRVALAAAKHRGVLLGKQGRVLADKYKSEAIAIASSYRKPVEHAFADGAITLKEVGEYLDKCGLLTRDGARWSPGTVHRLSKRLNISRDIINPLR